MAMAKDSSSFKLDLPEDFGQDLSPLETSQLITLQSLEPMLLAKDASLVPKFLSLAQTYLDLDPESTIQATLEEIFKSKGLNVRHYRSLLQGIKQQPEFRGYYKSLKKKGMKTGYRQNALEGMCIEADSNFFSNEDISSKLGFSSLAKCDNVECQSSDTKELDQVDWSSSPETLAKLCQLLRLDSETEPNSIVGVWGSGCGSLAFLTYLFSSPKATVLSFQDNASLIEVQRKVIKARGFGDRLKLVSTLTPENEDLTVALLGKDLLLDTEKRPKVLNFLRERMKPGGRIVTWKNLEVWLQGLDLERSGFLHWDQTTLKERPSSNTSEMYYIYTVK